MSVFNRKMIALCYGKTVWYQCYCSRKRDLVFNNNKRLNTQEEQGKLKKNSGRKKIASSGFQNVSVKKKARIEMIACFTLSNKQTQNL